MTAEEKVKAKWPDARAEQFAINLWRIRSGGFRLSATTKSELVAWEDAATRADALEKK